MSAVEVRDRLAGVARREAARVAHAVRPPTWQPRALARALCRDEPDIRKAAELLTAGDELSAQSLLARHFACRQSRFVVSPAHRTRLALAIGARFPDSTADAVWRADRIAAGQFDLLGYRSLRFLDPESPGETQIDWHFDPVHGRRAPRLYWSRVPYLTEQCGDHKIIWELNRHQHWLALGRAYWLSENTRYREVFARQLSSWMAANPPLAGINWASMLELGLRSISWIFALHFFVAGAPADGRPVTTAPWTLDLLLGLDRQLRLVEQNLSTYFSPNTHLLGEALALYVAGRTLPELRRAPRRDRIGRDVLIEQSRRQIATDGGHVERSFHYHRYALDFYLLALVVARRTEDRAEGEFAEAVRRLARFARTIADDTGRFPRIGDDDGGMLFPICARDPADAADSLALAAHLLDDPALAVGPPSEEVLWMTDGDAAGVAGSHGCSQPWPSTCLPVSGYSVSRSVRGDHLVVDSGPHGFLNGGHAHADALSMTLTVAGRPLFIDVGTGCYTADREVRDQFRSSQLHNTLTIGGRSQSEPAGPFHWASRADGALRAWRADAGFDFFEGTHDGYAPLVHRRSVLSRPGCWVIVDRVEGSGRHRVDCHWHLDPAWMAIPAGPGLVRAEHRDGASVWILSGGDFELVAGTSGQMLGWCSPAYGALVRSVALRTTGTVPLPYGLITVVVESADRPTLEPLAFRAGGRHDARGLAATLRMGSIAETLLFAPPGPADPSRICAAGRIETDASVCCWRETPQRSTAEVWLVGGGFARTAAAEVVVEPPRSAWFQSVALPLPQKDKKRSDRAPRNGTGAEFTGGIRLAQETACTQGPTTSS